MSKNIIFCADGTWNGPDTDEDKDDIPDITNVLKIFHNLAGHDTLANYKHGNEQDRIACDANGNEIQVAKYLHGVGDSDNPLKKIIEGGFGAGVISRIVRGYTFISRHYQPGDKIFLFGFSRGAYTARALGGFIVNQGLLNAKNVDLTDKEKGYRLGMKAWQMYYGKIKHPDLLAALAAQLAAWKGWFSETLHDNDFVQTGVEGIGVWDTVGALGIPIYDHGEQRDLFQFVDNDLNPKVTNALHLVSVDEQRGNFAPTLWNARQGVRQILMPGAHSDVGGGYPVKGNQSGLSDGGLDSMMRWAKAHEVLFSDPLKVVPNPDPKAEDHQPWHNPPFNVLPKESRDFPLALQMCIHPSVMLRWQGVKNYRPGNLKAYLDAQGNPLPGIIVARF